MSTINRSVMMRVTTPLVFMLQRPMELVKTLMLQRPMELVKTLMLQRPMPSLLPLKKLICN